MADDIKIEKWLRTYSISEGRLVVEKRSPPFPKGVQIYDTKQEAIMEINGEMAGLDG